MIRIVTPHDKKTILFFNDSSFDLPVDEGKNSGRFTKRSYLFPVIYVYPNLKSENALSKP